jgi:hypothetical protein
MSGLDVVAERPPAVADEQDLTKEAFRLRRSGDLAGAARAFAEGAERFPTALDSFRHPLFVKEAFRTLLEMQRLDEATALRDAWERTHGRTGWSRVLLARHLAKTGMTEEAVAAWRAALELEPGSGEALAYIAANAPPEPEAPASDLVPRMSPAELALLLATSRSRRRIIEFGCGGSTLALARSGAERIDSVESDRGWIDRLAAVPEMRNLVQAGRVGLHHVDIGPVGAWGTPTDQSGIRRWPSYALDIWQPPESRQVSLVLVDGRFRVACALAACLLGGEDCRIAFHDFADRPNYHVVLDYLTPVAEAETLSVFARKRDLDQGDLLRAVMKHVFLPG